MKNAIVTCFLCCTLMVMHGCGSGSGGGTSTTTTATPNPNNKPLILSAINLAGESGTLFGLQQIAKNNLATANEVADSVKKTIDGIVLPYLNGADGHTAGMIKTFLLSSLFNNLNPFVRDGIAFGSSILDGYLKIPSADHIINAEQKEYYIVFFTAVSRGCGDFRQRPNSVPRGLTEFRSVDPSF